MAVSNADVFDYWAEHIGALLEPSPVDLDPLSYPGKSGRIFRDPRGEQEQLVRAWQALPAAPE